jgi:inosine-uridine nucleoside N-ribohydrolase
MSAILPPPIIDTDAGHGDVLALIMMFKSKKFDSNIFVTDLLSILGKK